MSDDNIEDGEENESRLQSQLDGTVVTSTTSRTTSKHETNSAGTGSLAAPKSPAAVRGQKHNGSSRNSVTSWFTIPAPLKRLFDRFPLVAYPEDELPIWMLGKRNENVLYIFTSEEEAIRGQASFNPSCLKWQTYLKMFGIPFKTVPSSNHASPSGSLPFLLVGTHGNSTISDFTSSLPVRAVVTGNKLKRWARDQKPTDAAAESEDIRFEAYASLLDNRIRKAWLYQLYLNPANAELLKRLYVEPSSSNPIVQMTIASQLRSAAELEIIKASAKSGSMYPIDEAEIMREVDEAFAALSTLLGSAQWFFEDQKEVRSPATIRNSPALFDASLFAYTHLILERRKDGTHKDLRWNRNPLSALLERYENLVRHRERILDMYY